MLYNLGFISGEMGFGTVEVTRSADRAALTAGNPEIRGMPFITDSDAHNLYDILDAEYTMDIAETSAEGVISA